MNYWNQKRTNLNTDKKRTNWNQNLRSNLKIVKQKKIKKSLQYLLLLKKFNNIIDYKNIKLLKAFLNKYGKIRPRRKTRITLQKQHKIAKAIRKSRALGLIPFICDVKL
uniref:Ribosomal protein S18 n=1 Tax=Synura uvella TaxID=52557 RepID=A0A3G2QZN0_9STRA|nr:ribosomal protein S18 [Synura uvella]AYO28351.1 ribosomal protein S18 [Synura uvella]